MKAVTVAGLAAAGVAAMGALARLHWIPAYCSTPSISRLEICMYAMLSQRYPPSLWKLYVPAIGKFRPGCDLVE